MIKDFKSHTDEDKKRDLYLAMLDLSILKTYEALKHLAEEIRILNFMAERKA